MGSVFNFDNLDNAAKTSHSLSGSLWQHKTNVDSFLNIDPRVAEFCSLTSQENLLSKLFDNAYTKLNNTFVPWLENTIDEAREVERNNQALAGGIGAMGAGGAGISEPATISLSENDYAIDPVFIADLDGETKTNIRNKLKDLGFSDDEIKDIFDGKTTVDKVKLEKLCSDLEKAYKNDSSIRKLILEKYGFDVFNDDGTVIKDLAAITMIMDGKNLDDDYDLNSVVSSLLKPAVVNDISTNTEKSDNSASQTATAVQATEESTNNDDNKQSSVSNDDKKGTVHSGASFTAGTEKDNESEKSKEIDKLLSKSTNDSITKSATNSLRNRIPNVISSTVPGVKSASAGVGAVVAGLGTAAAVGGGGFAAAKHKKNDNDIEEDDTALDTSLDDSLNDNELSSDENQEVATTESSSKPDWIERLGI